MYPSKVGVLSAARSIKESELKLGYQPLQTVTASSHNLANFHLSPSLNPCTFVSVCEHPI